MASKRLPPLFLLLIILLQAACGASDGLPPASADTGVGTGTDATADTDTSLSSDGAIAPSSCQSDKDCAASSQVCDPLTKLCVACLSDAECGASQHCVGRICESYTGCNNSLGCTTAKGPDGGDQPICDSKVGECTACLTAADCPASNDCNAKACVPFVTCQNSTDCSTDEVCDKSTNRCVQCLGNNDCSSNELCEAGTCNAFVPCSSDKQCTPLGLLCDQAKGKCAQCLANSDCPGIYNCQSVGIAKTGLCVLDICAVGQGACQANQKVTCNAVGDGYASPQACPGQTTCMAPGNKPECKPWVCQPGTHCDGDKVVSCNADGLVITATEDCASKASKCLAGECKPVVCEPASIYCEGNTLKTCSADGTAVASSQLCSDGKYCGEGVSGDAGCQPTICTPGTDACDGTVATKCNANGSGYTSGGTNCVDGDKICVAGVCKSLVCDPLKPLFCDGNVVKQCASDGLAASTLQTCGDGFYCGAGVCSAQVCVPGTQVCAGDKPATCNADGSGFVDVGEACGANKSCSDGVCLTQKCGNGVVEDAEECDDLNQFDGDGCSSDCEVQMVTDGLELWLDASAISAASGSAVAIWSDQSGNNRHATAQGVGPTYNPTGWLNKPGVVFTGSQYLDFSALSLPGATVLQLGKIDAGASIGHGAQMSEPGAYFWANNYVFYQGSPYTYVGWAGPSQHAALRVLVRAADSATATMYANSASNSGELKGASGENPAGVTGSTPIRMSRIGKSGWSGPIHYLQGEMNEIAVWAKPLSPIQVKYMQKWLSKKWNLPDFSNTYASCSAPLTLYPDAPDGIYSIDPDGSGPIASANLYCDMTNGGLTLVANIYDSAGDDAPNSTDFVVSGWQQTASGIWSTKASTVDRAFGGTTGSAAVSLAFVEALGKQAGQGNLKMCFVHKDGYDTTCRDSTDGSLTLVSYATGNPKLTVYAQDKLTYTFGRLAGLAGSVDGYDATKFVSDGIEKIYYSPGVQADYQFGNSGEGIDVPPTDAGTPWEASIHFGGCGISYRPWYSNDNELGAGTCPGAPLQVNPSPASYGFRLYLGPGKPWTLVKSEPLTSKPTGSTTYNGGLGGQAPASIGGRTAWRMTSDWNRLILADGLGAPSGDWAVEVDVWQATSGDEYGIDLRAIMAGVNPSNGVRFGVMGGTANAFYVGAFADSTWTLQADQFGATSAGTWRTIRAEFLAASAELVLFVQGVEVQRWQAPSSVLTGSSLVLWAARPQKQVSVAFSNLKIFVRQ